MTRRILCVMIAMLLILGTPIQALAATHDAADFAGVKNAFETDTDAEVVVNLTQDITWEEQLTANENQSYTVNGNGNSVSGRVEVSGGGEVTVKADVEGAVIASDNVELTVNGDVTGSVDAYSGSDVTINGDITGDSIMDAYIYASNSEVTVNGDVTGWGIGANSDSTVTITGNVDTLIGISAESSTVTVDGNVTSDDETGIYAQNSNIEIGGGVTNSGICGDSGSGATIHANNSNVSVNGDVTTQDCTDTLGSDEGYLGDAILALDSNVYVGGDVAAGSAYAPSTDPSAANVGGSAIYSFGTSEVTVIGNVTGGNATGEGSIGGNAIVNYGGIVKVAGTVTAGKGKARDGQVGEYTKIEKPAPTPAPAASVVKEEAPVEISIIGTAGDEKVEIAVAITVAKNQKEIVIQEMDEAQVEALIESLKEILKEDTEGKVSIDVSSYKEVTSVKIPAKALEAIIETFGELEVVFNGGTIVIDAQMLEDLIDELGFFTISLK